MYEIYSLLDLDYDYKFNNNMFNLYEYRVCSRDLTLNTINTIDYILLFLFTTSFTFLTFHFCHICHYYKLL